MTPIELFMATLAGGGAVVVVADELVAMVVEVQALEALDPV